MILIAVLYTSAIPIAVHITSVIPIAVHTISAILIAVHPLSDFDRCHACAWNSYSFLLAATSAQDRLPCGASLK